MTGWAGTGRGGLIDQIASLARTRVLLVACDFDGTLAPIVDDPAQAQAIPESLDLLQRLAGLRRTHVAVVSGRSLADLATTISLPPDVLLVGSHGAEMEPHLGVAPEPEERREARELADALDGVAAGFPGARVERKPIGAALHYRAVDDRHVDGLLRAVHEGLGSSPGVEVKHGKKVIELCVTAADKGTALLRLIDQVRATSTIFLGDDITDEDAFAVLGPRDVAVKVGPGPSVAPWRAADPVAVMHLLAVLCDARESQVTARRATPL
jgi:trehalose-phosphatase